MIYLIKQKENLYMNWKMGLWFIFCSVILVVIEAALGSLYQILPSPWNKIELVFACVLYVVGMCAGVISGIYWFDNK